MTHSYTSHQVFLGVYHLLYMLFWIVFMWWVHHNQTIIIIMNISIIIIILVIISSRFYSHGIVNKSLVSSKVNPLWRGVWCWPPWTNVQLDWLSHWLIWLYVLYHDVHFSSQEFLCLYGCLKNCWPLFYFYSKKCCIFWRKKNVKVIINL